jgi:cation-transporting P-type ATPase F
VFARMSAEEKEILVRALQSRRHVVTMTGERDDDLPALRQADTGLDVRSNDTAGDDTHPVWGSVDLVLSGGDFVSITELVEDGRRMLDNLAKYVEMVLPSVLGPGLVLAAAALTGTALPLLPMQLLWLSAAAVFMLGAAFPADASPATDLMRGPPPDRARLGPRRSARVLLVTGMLIGWAFGLFHWAIAHGASVSAARTAVVDVLVFILLAHLLCCRLPRRPRLWFGRHGMRDLGLAAATGFLIMLQVAYTHMSVLNNPFGSAPLDSASWLRVIAATVTCFVMVMAANLLPLRPARTVRGARITRTE